MGGVDKYAQEVPEHDFISYVESESQGKESDYVKFYKCGYEKGINGKLSNRIVTGDSEYPIIWEIKVRKCTYSIPECHILFDAQLESDSDKSVEPNSAELAARIKKAEDAEWVMDGYPDAEPPVAPNGMPAPVAPMHNVPDCDYEAGSAL